MTEHSLAHSLHHRSLRRKPLRMSSNCVAIATWIMHSGWKIVALFAIRLRIEKVDERATILCTPNTTRVPVRSLLQTFVEQIHFHVRVQIFKNRTNTRVRWIKYKSKRERRTPSILHYRNFDANNFRYFSCSFSTVCTWNQMRIFVTMLLVLLFAQRTPLTNAGYNRINKQKWILIGDVGAWAYTLVPHSSTVTHSMWHEFDSMVDFKSRTSVYFRFSLKQSISSICSHVQAFHIDRTNF